MGLLNRKELLRKEDLKIEKVDLGSDDFVYVRQMTGHERDIFERSLVRQIKNEKGRVVDVESALEDFRAKLVVTTVCDEKGTLLLSPLDYEHLSNNMSAFKLEKIVNIAQNINKITEEDKEGLIKNSDAGQAGDSSSGSVEN